MGNFSRREGAAAPILPAGEPRPHARFDTPHPRLTASSPCALTFIKHDVTFSYNTATAWDASPVTTAFHYQNLRHRLLVERYRDDESMKKDIPFNKVLEQQAKNDPTLKKGDRTRYRLMVATAKLLQDTFFHDLRIVDICKHSGVSQGTFYLYFDDKMSVTTTTLSQFVHHIFQSLKDAGTDQKNLADAIHATTLAYVKQFYLNRGLLRCLMQMTEESAEFEKLYHSLNSSWNKRTAQA